MFYIKSIKFYNHQIFKNKIFDFTINNKPVKNIIIAGENGSGKTKLLEELYHISNNYFYIYTTIYSNITHEITIDISSEEYYDSENTQQKIKEAVLISSKNEMGNTSYAIQFLYDNNVVKKVKKQNFNSDIEGFKMDGIFSNVDINYKPRREVVGSTNMTLDSESNSIPDDLAFEIIQLFVDIAMQDSFELDSWVGNNPDEPVPRDKYHTKIKRFTNAFKVIFEDKIEYKEIQKNSIPIFEKDKNKIEISDLSSGEKQIIFRGVYLLRNKNSIKGVPIFIDEPELSMHPKWEKKIFDYYKNIFSEDSIQTSQIFIATHSEHILSSVLNHKVISPTVIKQYDALPTYIRNCIDHPDETINYTDNELIVSTKELIEIIKKHKS